MWVSQQQVAGYPALGGHKVHCGFLTKIFKCPKKFLAYDKTLADTKKYWGVAAKAWLYNAIVMKTCVFPESLRSPPHYAVHLCA